MTTPNPLERPWLDSAADHAVAALGTEVHAQLLAAGDHLATFSSELAHVFYTRAAGVWTRVGAQAFERWFATGAELAPTRHAAALAYFALESRTSVERLRADEHALGLDVDLSMWRRLVHMLTGESAVIRRSEHAQLRLPLEAAPEDYAGALPERIAWLDTAEANRAAYRWLTLQLAARRVFGTYAFRDQPTALFQHVRGRHAHETAFEALFLVAEGVRIEHCIRREYPGAVAERSLLMARWLTVWQTQPRPTHAQACDLLLALAVAPEFGLAHLPAWLPRATADTLLSALAPLADERASVATSLAITRQLLSIVAEPVFQQLTAADSDAMEDSEGGPVNLSELVVDGDALGADVVPQEDDTPAPAPSEADRDTPGQALADGASSGLDDTAAAPSDTAARVSSAQPRRSAARAQVYVYDEWDHTIGDYRSRFCHVHERELQPDSGAFYEQTVRSHATVLADVRRELERMRPERYRPLRGLEDGEDFDLNALTQARIDARARRTPNTRIYTARARQQRDVATLFLLDMSASTEQPYAEPGQPTPHRIIDTLKETLVVMSTALDALGDNYAIYGFSSQGRAQVEVYPVKTFAEVSGPSVRARIGGIVPRYGTRMGAALRHMAGRFAPIAAASKHLILLSDGYPQDQAYGPDRRSHSYGIEDTAMALRELRALGVTPLCITVDRAGHDYLRLMCDPAGYLVIDRLESLPRELPKIYRRLVQT